MQPWKAGDVKVKASCTLFEIKQDIKFHGAVLSQW